MPFDVFDYRTDIRNVVITPEIRSRFMRLEPGAVAPAHTHDLGHEVFLVLEGRAEFEVEGERAVLGPGQMCFVRADAMHQIRVVGDKPMTMYLSVTPHLEPTHTRWDDQGNKLPPSYGTSTAAERAARTVPAEPTAVLASRHIAAAKSLAQTASENAQAQEATAASLERALSAGDTAGSKAAIDAMWHHIYQTYRSFQELEIAWNELAPTVNEELDKQAASS